MATKLRKLSEKRGLIINTLLDLQCCKCGECKAILGRSRHEPVTSGAGVWSELICRECFLDKNSDTIKLCKKSKEHCAFKWHVFGAYNKPEKRYKVWKSTRLIEGES